MYYEIAYIECRAQINFSHFFIFLLFYFILFCFVIFCASFILNSKMCIVNCIWKFSIYISSIHVPHIQLCKSQLALAPSVGGIWRLSRVNWRELTLIWCNVKLPGEIRQAIHRNFYLLIWDYIKWAPILTNVLGKNFKHHEKLVPSACQDLQSSILIFYLQFWNKMNIECMIVCLPTWSLCKSIVK